MPNARRFTMAAGCAALAASAALSSALAGEEMPFGFEQPHMGTLFKVVLYAEDEGTARAAAEKAFARVAELNAALSDYDPESELSKFCRAPAGEAHKLGADLLTVMALGQDLARETGGAFDITIGKMTSLWRRSRRKGELPDAERLAAARDRTGFALLALDAEARTATLAKEHMQIDLGGIAKGYAAEEALRVLRDAGSPRASVAASGDIAVGDPPPGKASWEIGLAGLDAEPKEGAPTQTVLLKGAGVSTSGDTRQFVEIGGERYSHIVDPRTGLGLTRRISATVIAPSAQLSDPLATAVCILGPEKGIALIEAREGTECFVVWMEGDTLRTASSSGFAKFLAPAKPE
ncbi:MAG: FAD:protein FMN transferase [Verrucomicrobiales bacterium]